MVQAATAPPLIRGEWLPMSYKDWADLIPDGMHGEWMDGKGIIFVPPTEEHQYGAWFLANVLAKYAELFGLGRAMIAPFEMKLREGARPEPDVIYVAAEHADRWQGTRLIGPADLAVEFISDDSVTRDRRDKLAEYARAGVHEYLIIDRRRRPGRFDYYRLDADGTYQPVTPDDLGRYHSEVLPGFWINPLWFWEDPTPSVDRLMLRIAPEAYRRYLLTLLDEENAKR